MKNDIFNRTATNNPIISANMYNTIIGLTLCWGFFVNWYMLQVISPQEILSLGMWTFIGGYFASCFLGVYLFNSFDKPLISFIGYNLVVAPFGCVINIVVSRYSPDLVINAMAVTGVVTVTMMVLGTIYPAFFQQIYKSLNLAIIITIIVEIILIFFLRANFVLIDLIVVFIFCGYIGYDWGRANQIPKTIDNAIDSAAAIYMDIINLFLRILRIMGRRK